MQIKKYFNEILLVALLLINISGYGIITYKLFFLNEKQPDYSLIDNPIDSIEEKDSTISNTYKVEIKGEVVTPGVYELSSDQRVNDAILLAGGFTNNAYTNNINLSRKISDELVIYVYSNYEQYLLKQDNTKVVYKEKECNCPTYDIDTCILSGDSIIQNGPSDNTDNISDLININTADISKLTTLSGIGEAKAKDIISYREKYGNFASIEDIKKVSGISDATYEKIKDSITI